MKIDYKHSIVGSVIAFVIALSCCWLPLLLIGIGSATGLVSFTDGLEDYSGVLMSIGVVLILIAAVQYYIKKRTDKTFMKVILRSEITCPACQFKTTEEMPTNACQYFYECVNCSILLKPTAGDCCVYCSFGTIPCPPIQRNEGCC